MIEHSENSTQNPVVKNLIRVGWLCLAVSSFFLYLSVSQVMESSSGSEVTLVVWMMLARLAGIFAFGAGVLAMFNNRWNTGVILIIGSVVLPFLSLYYHGHI